MTSNPSETHPGSEIRIHIDQRPRHSPSPTTGEALYRLGEVAHGHELYREVTGDDEDRLIPNLPEEIVLVLDEHFHSGPHHHGVKIEIFIDKKPRIARKHRMTGAQLKTLGEVKAGYDLFQEIKGKDDLQIKDGDIVHIKEGERFYSVPSSLNPGAHAA